MAKKKPKHPKLDLLFPPEEAEEHARQFSDPWLRGLKAIEEQVYEPEPIVEKPEVP